MDLAEIEPGMTVADIGAGNGYYTIRLAERVGKSGRVLAQDIDAEALRRLGERVDRERLDNVSIKAGDPADPLLPENSFDRIFMVHMYHEVAEPMLFFGIYGPRFAVADRSWWWMSTAPTDQHGIDPLLLSCEFQQAGFELVAFKNAPELQATMHSSRHRLVGRNRPIFGHAGDRRRPCAKAIAKV